MAIDLAGGMSPSSDFFLAEQPDDPEFRESASFWVSDDKGLIGLPRIGIEARLRILGQGAAFRSTSACRTGGQRLRGEKARAALRSMQTGCVGRLRLVAWSFAAWSPFGR